MTGLVGEGGITVIYMGVILQKQYSSEPCQINPSLSPCCG